MAQQIILKRTTVSGRVPSTSNLSSAGEIAVNLTDNKLYVRGTGTDILELTSQPLDNMENINITSPVHEQHLSYDAASNKWVNSTVATDTAIAMSIVFG